MKSPLFEPATREAIERKVRDVLNQQSDFLSEDTAGSTRAAGDAIQIAKITRRIGKFEKVKEFWLAKPEV
jgi:propanediol dehydratase small subunit